MSGYIYIHEFSTAFGVLLIGDYKGQLCLCDWKYRRMRISIDQRIQKGLEAKFEFTTTALHKEVVDQLNRYFEGEQKDFDISLQLVGSNFQQSVWRELQRIPFGTTETYLGLSKKLENEKAIRAVASANGANAISIIVPCHRVIGSNGELTGYAGGLPAKKKLLKLEGKVIGTGQTSLF